MPKTNGNKRSNSQNSSEWGKFEFVAINLTEDEKKQFKKAYTDKPNDLLGQLDGLLKNGYKLSLSYDNQNNCVLASLTGKDPNSPNYNYVMTSRAGESWESMALALFKHYVVCDDEDWGGDTREDGRSWG
jgi:hypothetical protein